MNDTPTSVITLRSITHEDMALLHAMEVQCFEPHMQFTIEYLKELFEDDECSHLALVDGVPAGFLMAKRIPGEREHIGYVDTLEVLPAYRRHGVAHALLTFAQETLRLAGCRHMLLHVASNNLAAQALYRKHGYKRRDMIANFYPDGTDALLLIRSFF